MRRRMKDIATVCSQNEVAAVNAIRELSPPCVKGHHPAALVFPDAVIHTPELRGFAGGAVYASPDRLPPPPWMCSGSPSPAFCPPTTTSTFAPSRSPTPSRSPLATLYPPPPTTTTTMATFAPSPTPSAGAASPNLAYPSAGSAGFSSPSPSQSVSPSSTLCPATAGGGGSFHFAPSPTPSGSSPSSSLYPSASVSFTPSPTHSASSPSPSQSLYPPPPPPSATAPAGLAPPSPSGFSSFLASHQLTMTSLIPSPSLSMLSSTPSPSTSFSPSPPTPFAASPSSSSGAFIPSPSKCGTPSDVSRLSPPMVTIKCEEDSSLSASPQPQQLPPLPPLAAPQVVPLRSLGALRASSPGKTVSGSLLPPCKICLDKASGFHYGLNTCEACKGFFRRSLKRGVSYVCARSGNCDVTGEKRNMCGYCRYQKCIALGMSKKAIKTGRYTHAKRTKDTLEIKRLMRVESPTEEDEDLDFETIIAQVVQAHDEFVISSTRVPVNVIKKKQMEKVEEINLNAKHFGNMTSVSSDEHQEIYRLTGIDVDDRRELMKFHVKNSEKWIRGYINFAKKLPGFRELSLNDQANLVKYSRIEFWFLGSYPGYNTELGVAVMPNGRCFTRREMCNVWQTKYIDVSFDLSQKLQKLQVTPEEIIIVKAICLTAGDRCAFKDPDMVGRIQWRMIRCLQYLLQRRCSSHSEFVSIFSKVFMCLTDLRDLNEAEYQTIQNTPLYQLFTEHPLIMEVLPY